jgi:DDE superfamily endonuclease
VAAQRVAWQALQPEIDIDRLVFIDETGASTKMARRYGRAPRGKRCVAPIPHGHWQTTTFVGALRATGMTAPMVLDGAMDGAAFETYVKEILAPTLNPGDIVVMDNLPAHKRAQIRDHWRPAHLSAALFARSQSDRDGLRQTQGRSAQGRSPFGRSPMDRHCRRPDNLHPTRLRQLLRRCRLRSCMSGICSSWRSRNFRILRFASAAACSLYSSQ